MESKNKYRYNSKVSNAQLEYLKSLEKDNERRRTAIESKLLHISSSSGTVVSLVGLMITLFYDKLSHIGVCEKIAVAFVCIFIITFLFLSIFTSRRTLNIKRYGYMSGDVSTIMKNHRDEDKLKKEEIEDLLQIIPHNNKILNGKGTELIRSHLHFNRGLYGICVLLVILIVISFSNKPKFIENQTEPEKIEVDVKLLIESDSSVVNIKVNE